MNTWISSLLLFLLPSAFLGNEEVRVVENVLRKSTGERVYLEATLGSTAELPCNVTPSLASDSTSLVVWFKNGSNVPFYTFDIKKSPSDPVHWLNPDSSTANRSYFESRADPARLELTGINLLDMADYKCRVDFEQQPSSIQIIVLKVIVPPETPLITVEDGRLHRIKLGPYRVGENVTVKCTVLGGDPVPTVEWYTDKRRVLKTVTRSTGGAVSSDLLLVNLDRSYLDTTLTCQARNSNSSLPQQSTVQIDMIFSPTSAVILNKDRIVEEGNTEVVKCQVTGARPTPDVSWRLGNLSLPHRDTKIYHNWDRNITFSEISIKALKNRTGLMLVCTARTPGIEDILVEDKLLLNIYHKPEVSLSLGVNLNASDIRESHDVYFVCDVRANPPVKLITWKLNGKEIKMTPKGAKITEKNLVIQNLTRHWEGVYTCEAKNELGTGYSHRLPLNIRYTPVCVDNQTRVYQTMRGEQISVACTVHANPTEHIGFEWRFNNTSRSYPLKNEDIRTFGNRSIAQFTPRTDMDYGFIECWGVNSVGRQEQPCVFRVDRGGPPTPPTDCRIKNVTYSGFQVECEDTRLLMFNIISREAKTGNVTHNVQFNKPIFTLTDLKPGTAYNCRITASNSDGESQPVELHQITLSEPEKQIAERKVREDEAGLGGSSSKLGIIIGVSLTLLVITVVLLITAFCRHFTRSRRRDGPDLVNCSNTTEDKKLISTDFTSRNAYSETSSSAHSDPYNQSGPDCLKSFASSRSTLIHNPSSSSQGESSQIFSRHENEEDEFAGIKPAPLTGLGAYSTLRNNQLRVFQNPANRSSIMSYDSVGVPSPTGPVRALTPPFRALNTSSGSSSNQSWTSGGSGAPQFRSGTTTWSGSPYVHRAGVPPSGQMINNRESNL